MIHNKPLSFSHCLAMSKSSEEAATAQDVGYATMVGIMLRGMQLLVETVSASVGRVGSENTEGVRAQLDEQLLKLKAAQVAPEQMVPPDRVAAVCRYVHQFQALIAPVDPDAPELAPEQIAFGCLPRNAPVSGEQMRNGLLTLCRVVQDMADTADWDRVARYISAMGEFDYELGRVSALDVREQLTSSKSA